MSLRVLALVVLALAACGRPARLAPTTSLDAYADRGPLRVRGARASAPGPAIYRALSADAQLAGRGEPDTVEVVRRGKGLRVVVTYPRGRGEPRQVVVVPKSAVKKSGRRSIASRPTRQRSTARAGTPATVEPDDSPPTPATVEPTDDSPPTLAAETPPSAEDPPAPSKMTLTARQTLECAVDAERDECRSVCAGASRSDYEWCR